ncbi:MAG: VOC family protein [Methanospirillum sp.]|nr:VOC family protein [Methanospirillum sp.]
MPTIVHFDVPADDIERAQGFYGSLFGWTFTSYGGPYEYNRIETTAENGSPGVAGGMGPRGESGQQITNYVGVPSVTEYLELVTALGGAVLMPQTPIPGFGWLAVCLDTEGNRFGLFEDDPEAA